MPPDVDTSQGPLSRAIAKMDARTPIGARLRSAQWARLPLALRESAFFSATVTSAHLLSGMQGMLRDRLALEREQLANGKTRTIDREEFLLRMRDRARALGLGPTDPALAGGLRDITSIARLSLIYRQQVESAQGHARWLVDQDPSILDAYPAQELLRVSPRRVPRDWPTRWRVAGGPGNPDFPMRLIALKSDPIWIAISAFGVPWPPFDFNSGMGLMDVSREEAEAIGLLAPGQQVAPQDQAFAERMRASARGLDQRWQRALRNIFGDQIEFDGDQVVVAGGALGRQPGRGRPQWPDPPEAAPDMLMLHEADAALARGMTVRDPTGEDVRFGARLRDYLSRKEGNLDRLRWLKWAEETVRSGRRVDLADRRVYSKLFRKADGSLSGFIVLLDTASNVWNIRRAEHWDLRRSSHIDETG